MKTNNTAAQDQLESDIEWFEMGKVAGWEWATERQLADVTTLVKWIRRLRARSAAIDQYPIPKSLAVYMRECLAGKNGPGLSKEAFTKGFGHGVNEAFERRLIDRARRLEAPEIIETESIRP